MDNVYGAVIMTEVIARVHLVHLTNADQRQMAADLQTRPTNLGCKHHRHLLSPKADTHFTVQRRVEG